MSIDASVELMRDYLLYCLPFAFIFNVTLTLVKLLKNAFFKGRIDIS